MVIKINYTSSDIYVSTNVSPIYVVVNYSAVNNGSGVAWGAITGTLSNQTDLQTALDAKFDDPTGTTSQYLRGDGSLATFPSLTGFVPYTGATTNVNLGEFGLTAGQLTLDTSPTGTAAVGTTRWNDTIGSSETTLKGGSVILKNGVDLVARIVNKVTPNTTLTKAAYQAVRVSGAQGQRLAVAFAQANNDANSADTIGLVTETILTNQEGFIITVGQIENINTTGSLQGETWVDGDVLYLSPTTPGAITKVKPTGAGHIVVIGYVEYAHANNGKIYVKVMNGWELDELHDVSIVSAANNEALIYESSSQLWKNKTIASALGYTPVPTTRTLTINGTAFDLSANRSWTIAAGITGSGVANQLTYWNGTGSVTGSANLVWDNTNARLGIGNTSPAQKIDILGTNVVAIKLKSSTNSGATSYQAFNDLNNSFEFGMWGSTRGAYSAIAPGDGYLYSSVGLGIVSLENIKFGSSVFERMRLTAAGRLLLGTTTEGTNLLDVNGTARVSGAFSVLGDTTLLSTNTTILVSTDYRFNNPSNTVNTIFNAYTFRLNGIRAANIGFILDGANWFSGTGMSFVVVQGPDSTVNAPYEAMRLTSNGNLLLGTITNQASSKLTINSTTQGFLPPRMTTTQKNAIGTPAAGLQVYDTTLNQMSYYNGTTWINF